jgi:hypothetical protein
MDLARARQLVLVALSTEHEHEAWNALGRLKAMVRQAGRDIHWFASTIGGSSEGSRDDRATAFLTERVNRLEAIVAGLQLDLAQERRTSSALRQELRWAKDRNAVGLSAAYQAAMFNRADGPPGPFGHHSPQQAAAQLLSALRNRLTTKERDFLETVTRWRGEPTEKQMAWLVSLWGRWQPADG